MPALVVFFGLSFPYANRGKVCNGYSQASRMAGLARAFFCFGF
jgi:hypothetical protein